jgi:hypothetical protein
MMIAILGKLEDISSYLDKYIFDYQLEESYLKSQKNSCLMPKTRMKVDVDIVYDGIAYVTGPTGETKCRAL